MKRKTKKARKFIKRRLKGGNTSQITVGNIANALTDVKQETGISEKVELDESTLDIIMQKLEDGLENINDYYIDSFEILHTTTIKWIVSIMSLRPSSLIIWCSSYFS